MALKADDLETIDAAMVGGALHFLFKASSQLDWIDDKKPARKSVECPVGSSDQ